MAIILIPMNEITPQPGLENHVVYPAASKTRSRIIVVLAVIVIGILVAGVAQLYSVFLKTQITGPTTNSQSGELDTSNLTVGEHTLEMRGRTASGTYFSQKVNFVVEDSSTPY